MYACTHVCVYKSWQLPTSASETSHGLSAVDAVGCGRRIDASPGWTPPPAPPGRGKGRDRWETRGFWPKTTGKFMGFTRISHDFTIQNETWTMKDEGKTPTLNLTIQKLEFNGIKKGIWWVLRDVWWWVNSQCYQTWWFQHQRWRLKQEHSPCSLSWPWKKNSCALPILVKRRSIDGLPIKFPTSTWWFLFPFTRNNFGWFWGTPIFSTPGGPEAVRLRVWKFGRGLCERWLTQFFWGGQMGKEEVRLRVGLVMPILGNLQLIQLQSRWSLDLSQWCKDSNVSWQGWGLHDLIDDKLACLRSLVGTCKVKTASPKMVWNMCNMCVDE